MTAWTDEATPVHATAVKILISAYACDPARGSEPGIGWHIAREVARYHETWILTSRENESVVRETVERDGLARMRFVFIGPGRWTLEQHTRRRPIPLQAQLHYYLWQLAAFRAGRRLQRRIAFDIVHHVTLGRYWSPSFLSLLPVPFVWGPVGGGEATPLAYWWDLGWRGLAQESLRYLAQRAGELDPFVRITARRSCIARATTQQTAERLQRIGAQRIHVIPHTAMAERDIGTSSDAVPPHRTPGARYFLSVTRLVPWKGVHLGLRGFAEAALDGVEYWIVGEGYDRSRLERLAVRLGIDHRVRFFGEQDRHDIRRLMQHSLALVHPSLHDSGGAACLEAMAVATPVVCMETGGPALQVTDATGFLIPLDAPRDSVQTLAWAMRRIATDDRLRRRLGEEGLRRLRDLFTWEEHGRRLSSLYERVSTGQGSST